MDRRSLLRCLAALPFIPSALASKSREPDFNLLVNSDGSSELLEDGKRVAAWDTDVYSAEYAPMIKFQAPNDLFGWSPDADGIARIIERGECVGEFGPWTPFTVFGIELDKNNGLSYSKDGAICRQVTREALGEWATLDAFTRQSRIDGQGISSAPTGL